MPWGQLCEFRNLPFSFFLEYSPSGSEMNYRAPRTKKVIHSFLCCFILFSIQESITLILKFIFDFDMAKFVERYIQSNQIRLDSLFDAEDKDKKKASHLIGAVSVPLILTAKAV